jgi:hypothetical protein
MNKAYIQSLRNKSIQPKDGAEREAVINALQAAGELIFHRTLVNKSEMTWPYLHFSVEGWSGDNAPSSFGVVAASEVLVKIWMKRGVSVILNSEYTATYEQGSDFVNVGCQKIQVSKLRELLAGIDKVS